MRHDGMISASVFMSGSPFWLAFCMWSLQQWWASLSSAGSMASWNGSPCPWSSCRPLPSTSCANAVMLGVGVYNTPGVPGWPGHRARSSWENHSFVSLKYGCSWDLPWRPEGSLNMQEVRASKKTNCTRHCQEKIRETRRILGAMMMF